MEGDDTGRGERERKTRAFHEQGRFLEARRINPELRGNTRTRFTMRMEGACE